MNVVDSSAWLEYFAGGNNAGFFAEAIENTGELVVPTVCLYEAFKRILQQRSESEALQAIAVMQQGMVVSVDSPVALSAARLSLDRHLPMADSIILAITKATKATLWTQDAHFEGMEGVRFRSAS